MDIHVAMLHFLQSKKTLQIAGSNLSFFSAIKRYVKFRKHNFYDYHDSGSGETCARENDNSYIHLSDRHCTDNGRLRDTLKKK